MTPAGTTSRRKPKKAKTNRPSPFPEPPPAVIFYLRCILLPGYPADETEAARRYLGQILKTWSNNENLSELRRMLGVQSTRGGRRTQAAHDRQFAVVADMFQAASSGKDVSSYRKAADALYLDEKVVERAWQALSAPYVETMARWVASDPDKYEATSKMIALLPKPPR